MSKNIYIDNISGNTICGITENGELLEYHIEKSNKTQIVGSIYKGIVKNVLPGMQAAFVDIGLDKNGYLSINDTLIGKNEVNYNDVLGETLNLKEGDEILVQAVKDPTGYKGARLTMIISFAGKYTVYAPQIKSNAISRKIEDENKRVELEKILSKIKVKNGGFIARTASQDAKSKEIKDEANKLVKQYLDVVAGFNSASVGDVLYSDGDLLMRVIREVVDTDEDRLYVGDEEIYARLKKLPKSRLDYKKQVTYYDKASDMFSDFGLAKQIETLLRNKVYLNNGAYIIIDRNEALTVIDVNTGSFVGEEKLEDTVFETNILASKEIARQVRLRNIGGIVIVDFIDMESEEHRTMLVNKLEEYLKTDRIKCNVIGMTGLGLVEFTRQKKRKEINEILNKPCPYCHGDGKIYSNEYIIMKIRTSLLDLFANDYTSAIIELNKEICEYIVSSNSLKKDIQKFWSNKRIYLIPHKTYHQEFFITKGENSKVLDLPDTAILLY